MTAGRVTGFVLAIAVTTSTLVAPRPSGAQDVGVSGRSMKLTVSASGRQVLKSLQRDTGVHFGPASAGSDLSGSLELWYVDTPSNRASLPLPSPWSLNTGVTAKWKNAAAPAGVSPAKTATLRNGSMAKVAAKGLGGIDITAPPGPGGILVVFTIDNVGDASHHRYCSLYKGALGSEISHRATGASRKLSLRNGVATPCPTCLDGTRNDRETGVDCGGPSCAACPAGQGCSAASDCQSGVCQSGVCQAPACTDGVKNGDETAVDCGNSCPDCANGLACDSNDDCQSGACIGGFCRAATCFDGVKNGGETAVDCGGACAPCTNGQACTVWGDCQSGFCWAGVCQTPTCTDGVKNGTETDLDCGSSCPGCATGRACGVPGDCASGICLGNICRDPSCADGIKDGTETGIDCGGACAPCGPGSGCQVATDCTTGVCTAHVCQGATCADGIRNGSESDVDCGGSCLACVPFTVTIDSPAHGIFSLAPSAAVTGHTTGVGPAGADLTINGTPVTLAANGTFSTSVPLSQAAVFNPIHARLSRHFDGKSAYDRVVVIAGNSIADGSPSPNGVGMRFNDTGLDQIEPLATTLVSIDPSTLVTAGTTVLSDYCYLSLGSLCLGSVDVSISGTPPPQIGPVGIALDSQTGAVKGDITIHDLRVTVNVDNASGIPLHCELHLTVPTTALSGLYDLSPMSSQPTKVDVQQVGNVSVQATGTTYQSDCDGLLGDLEESLIGQSIGDVGALFANGMQDFLNQVDANGNTAIAGAIETALGGIDIAGPVGSGLGIDLDAPFTSITEDPLGITFAANIAATTLVPDPQAPNLTASYHVNEAFPTFAATTPVQHLPYGIGLGISTSGFNQLLRSQIESGLLRSAITSIDLGGGPTPVTAGLLAAAFPQFGTLPAATPITIRIAPTIAPVLTGAAGPSGELGELKMAQIRTEFVQSAGLPGEIVHLAIAVDTRIGLQLAFQPGGIGFVLATPAASDVTIALLRNPLGVSESALQSFLPGIIGGFLPDIAGALESFPLPAFLGLSLSGLEVSRNGQYYSIFADLTPACTSGATCPSGVCLANTCQAPTCVDGIKNGAETGTDCGGGSCPGCATGGPCFLSTDCAVGGCSGGICQPTCSSGAQCPSGVCTGGFCRVPNCADGVQNGSETGVDCGGPHPNCVRCANGQPCGGASDCVSGICTGGICQAPSCTDGAKNGTETDVDCGGSCPGCGLGKDCGAGADCQSAHCSTGGRCTCGNQLFTFTVNSNSGGVFDSAEWPGGQAAQSGPAGCSVTINRPSGNIDQVCTLQPPFSVAGRTGYSQCFGSGGEDGDGCEPVSCPPAGAGSCCSGRPSCSAALNGSGSARYRVQCLE